VEPIKIATQTKVRDGMPRPYIIFEFVETPQTAVAGLSSQRSSCKAVRFTRWRGARASRAFLLYEYR
jgi:hypothetical protein